VLPTQPAAFTFLSAALRDAETLRLSIGKMPELSRRTSAVVLAVISLLVVAFVSVLSKTLPYLDEISRVTDRGDSRRYQYDKYREDSFSACLLWMDENSKMPEWYATFVPWPTESSFAG
jgi:hypothetical protein